MIFWVLRITVPLITSYPKANLPSTISLTKSNRSRSRLKIILPLKNLDLRIKRNPIIQLRKYSRPLFRRIWSNLESSLSKDKLKKLSQSKKRRKWIRKSRESKLKISKSQKKKTYSKLRNQLKLQRRQKWWNKSEKLRKLLKGRSCLSSTNSLVISKAMSTTLWPATSVK